MRTLVEPSALLYLRVVEPSDDASAIGKPSDYSIGVRQFGACVYAIEPCGMACSRVRWSLPQFLHKFFLVVYLCAFTRFQAGCEVLWTYGQVPCDVAPHA